MGCPSPQGFRTQNPWPPVEPCSCQASPQHICAGVFGSVVEKCRSDEGVSGDGLGQREERRGPSSYLELIQQAVTEQPSCPGPVGDHGKVLALRELLTV